MENITTTSMTLIARVRSACPQAVGRNLSVGVRGGFHAPMHDSATSTVSVVNDVAYLPSRRPPV